MSLLVAVSILAAACGAGADQSTDQSFDVGPAPRLVIGAGDGDITVRAADTGAIRVIGHVTNSDNVDFEAEQTGDTVSITTATRFSANLLGDEARGRVDMTITVPSSTAVEIGIRNGDVTLDGVVAGGSVTAASGTMRLRNVSGDYTGGAGTGEVVVTGATGSFTFTVGTGDISFEGDLLAGGRNEFETGAGDITLELGPATGAALDARSATGPVRSSLQLSDEARPSSGRLTGLIGDGGADLKVSTGGGAITLR